MPSNRPPIAERTRAVLPGCVAAVALAMTLVLTSCSSGDDPTEMVSFRFSLDTAGPEVSSDDVAQVLRQRLDALDVRDAELTVGLDEVRVEVPADADTE